MEDKYALVKKIIKDIENVMTKNADLSAFDIVPVDHNFKNKSPVLHLENCLGLESWCVKHVYMYCYTEIMDKCFPKTKRKTSKLPLVNSKHLNSLLNVTLLLNPELSTLWNKRREMVQLDFLNKESELKFTRLVLSRKSKCNDAFAYRRWLLQSILSDLSFQSNHIENLINDELQICELTSDKSSNNYHSWNHRMWILNYLKRNKKDFDLNLLFIKEYGFSEKWSSKHVSDFSCFHYRQFCIKNILTISKDSWNFLVTEMDLRRGLVRLIAQNFPKNINVEATEDNLLSYSEQNLVSLLLSNPCRNGKNAVICRQLEVLFRELLLNNELLKFYKYHETLWYHRRFIIHEIITTMYDHFGVKRQNGVLLKNPERIDSLKQAKIVRYDSNCIYSSVLFNVLSVHEKDFIEERRIDGDNYADRHEKYLKFVEGLNNVI